MSSSFSQIGGKKEENRRTLTDFKIMGLEIKDLGWTWGTIPSPEGSQKENAPAEEASNSQSENKSAADGQGETVAQAQTSENHDAPSRLRIYFHTPATADDSNLISNSAPSESRKGKRKKLEDDDGEDDEVRAPPPPPQAQHLNAADDKRENGSVAPSVAETTSEGDWLMAAIAEDENYEHEDHTYDEQHEETQHEHEDQEDGEFPHFSWLKELSREGKGLLLCDLA
jgi:20S proteasome subunit alpha 6